MRGEECVSITTGAAEERCAVECENENMLNDAEVTCQVSDDYAGVDDPAHVVLGSADDVDEEAVDDKVEEELAQRLEDLPVQDLGQPGVLLNDFPLLCQTTILVLNAAGLVESTGGKFRAFHKMVKDLDPKPDIIVVHELGGYSGAEKIQFKLVGALRRYDCVYTQKPLVDAGDHKAGAGVLILFKRELFRGDVIRLPSTVERPLLLDGHMRTVCLWRKQYPHLPPLVVTAAYIPPVRGGVHAQYNRDVRSEGLAAIPKMADYVNKVRYGCHHIMAVHVNASDGCIDLKTGLPGSISMAQVAELELDTTPSVPSATGMKFCRTIEGEVIHRRNKIKSISKSTPSGRALSKSLAKRGYLPTMGVSEPLRPSTWRVCKRVKCKGACICKRRVLTGQNDVVYVPQELLWGGYKTKAMKSTVRKMLWHPTVDHSLVWLTLPIFGVLQQVLPVVNRLKVENRRFKLPVELLRRAILLRKLSDQMDEAMRNGAASVQDAWAKIDGCRTSVTVEAMTAEEVSAAYVNAPKGFWDHFGKRESDPGVDTTAVSSSVLLQLIVNELDGSVITSNSTETADLILQYRRQMAQIPQELPVPDCVVYEALRSVAIHNSGVPGLSRDSTAFKTSVVPDHFWRKTEERRHGVQVPHRGYLVWESRIEARGDTMAAFDQMKMKHSDACGLLNRVIDYEEVNNALSKLKDVGAGPDNLPPIVLSDHVNHGPHCQVVQALVKDFNEVFKTGVAPESWQNYRMLLHHKGHGAHPAALESYRALGIGNCLKKVMSMVLEERLNTFLTQTGALSHEQLGFRRKSGTSEAVLAFSEVVRNTAKDGPVLTAFVDVRAAYDSVIREVLYAKMLRMGIGGNFLTTIQEFYHAPTADLEVGGYVIGKVDMELGLAQGSPLSPTLFNIYIDSCIRGLSEKAHVRSMAENVRYGIHLPSAKGDRQTQSIVSLWYADDSVIFETDIHRLQWLADEMTKLLAEIGLRVNVRKTKLMVTAGHKESMVSLKQFVENIEAHSPLMMSNQVVQIVSEFSYLGVMVNSRGNWKDAWSKAYKKASLRFHEAVLGGTFIDSGTLAEMTKVAHAKIWSQMDGIVAVTGVGGCKTSAFHSVADDCIQSVLKAIVGHWSLNSQALRIESGVWDTATRIDMLVLRFFTKICSSDPESLISRVVRMSLKNMSREEYDAPEKKWAAVDKVHRQSWVQRALASAERLGVPKGRLKDMQPGLLLVIQEQRQDQYGVESWVTVQSPTTYIPAWDEREVLGIRLALQEAPQSGYVEGEDAWTVRPEHVSDQKILLGQLSEPLRLAYHAAIRKEANKRRRVLVKSAALPLLEHDHHLQGWASMCGYFSFMPPYWHVHDVAAARAMLRVRLNVAWNECAVRMKPAMPKRSCKQKEGCYERIHDRWLRACYLCDAIHGQSGIFESESLYHMLMECPHEALKDWRRDLRKAVVDLARLDETKLQAKSCPGFNEAELWAVMMLCMSTDSFPNHQPTPRVNRPLEVRPESDDARREAEAIRMSKPIHDKPVINNIVKWMRPLTFAWMGVLREYRGVGVAEAMPGARLTELVCKGMRKLFTLHRKLLKNNQEYQGRTRDPPRVNLAGALDSEPETEPSVD